MIPDVPSGIYEHYKGGRYTVLFTARVSTNGLTEGERLVIYVSHTTGDVCARDLDEFTASVSVPMEGEPGRRGLVAHRRFRFVGPAPEEG